eukprot:5211302-Alexandrium_andersonii.AAC.1
MLDELRLQITDANRAGAFSQARAPREAAPWRSWSQPRPRAETPSPGQSVQTRRRPSCRPKPRRRNALRAATPSLGAEP